MGGSSSKEAPAKVLTFDDLPMPSEENLQKMFMRFLDDMNLPDAELMEVMKLPPEKKWRLIYDKNSNQSRYAASFFIRVLRAYADFRGEGRKKLPKEMMASGEMLNHLAISLSTNALSWVKEFCDAPHNGTDVLLVYLGVLSDALRTDNDSAKLEDADRCIVCLKALMNNSYGFNSVMMHDDSIKLIALNVYKASLKTLVLIFELLGAICLVGDGHRRFLDAFDNFRVVHNERARFEYLIRVLNKHASDRSRDATDFQIACMSLINVVVHSCEDMNMRVYLQGEFTYLGLGSILAKLEQNPDLVLHGQLSAYRDNYVDVGILQRGVSEAKAALKLAAKLEDELQMTKESAEETQNTLMERIATLEKELGTVTADRDNSHADAAKNIEKLESYERTVELLKKKIGVMKLRLGKPNMLRREAAKLDAQLKAQGMHSLIDDALAEDTEITALADEEIAKTQAEGGEGGALGGDADDDDDDSDSDDEGVPPPPAAAPTDLSGGISARRRSSIVGGITAEPMADIPMPPAPPPPMGDNGMPPPPAAPPMLGMMNNMGTLDGLREAKRVIRPNVPLPTLNWQPLRATKNTIFEKLDDEHVHEELNFGEFEELFKTNTRSHEIQARLDRKFSLNQPEGKKAKVHVIDSNRSRNVVLATRRIGLTAEQITHAIESADLRTLVPEHVDLLLKVVPTAEERLLLAEKVSEDKQLAEGDRFLYEMTKIERYEQKLRAMYFMGTFDQDLQYIMPQIDAIIVASNALRSSERFVVVLEVILAFGNYLNSAKRGGVYGFKVTSFDRLNDTRSSDKKQSLLMFIARTVRQHYPDAAHFYKDLRFVDKAALVSLPILSSAVADLRRGLGLVGKERDLQRENTRINHFYEANLQKVLDLEADHQQMMEMYSRVVRHFGDDPQKLDANEFFSCFTRFMENWDKAVLENAKADKALAKAQALQALQELHKGKGGGGASGAAGAGAGKDPMKSEANMIGASVASVAAAKQGAMHAKSVAHLADQGAEGAESDEEDEAPEALVNQKIDQIYDGALDDLIRRNKFMSFRDRGPPRM